MRRVIPLLGSPIAQATQTLAAHRPTQQSTVAEQLRPVAAQLASRQKQGHTAKLQPQTPEAHSSVVSALQWAPTALLLPPVTGGQTGHSSFTQV